MKTVRLEVSGDQAPIGIAAWAVTEDFVANIESEKLMKTWQILLVIWMTGVGFWIANQFNRQNIERLKKRSSGG